MDDTTSLVIKVDSTQVKSSATALNDLGKAGENAERGVKRVESASGAMSASLKAAAVAAGALFASLQLIDKLKDISMLAARYETLGVVMKVVGNNVGYTGAEMEKYTKALQKNGIASIESRETLTRMAAAHIDLAKANGLARIAQDAAVIGNTNSSEAFSRMIVGIQRGETEIMKTIGLNVDFMGSQQKLAKELGITTQQLTPMQKVLSNTNEAFRAGVGIAGSYEAAMGTAGKMANSLKRYIDDIKVSLGAAFGPAMTLLIDQLTASLKKTDTQLKDNKTAVDEWGNNFRKTLIDLEIHIQGVAILIDLLGGNLTIAGKALFAFGNAIGNENSVAQYNKMIELNKMFEERAIASSVAIEKLKYERDKDIDSIRELAKVEEDTKEATRMRLALSSQLQLEASEERQKAEEEAAKATKESAKLADAAAKEYANFYQSTLDRLLPLVKEQKDYNAALAVLKDMDPTQSTEAYRIALDNLEKTLTVNIEKAAELRSEVERLGENIQLGSTGPDELRNEAAATEIQQQNELILLQEIYNEKVEKQVTIQKELGVAYGLSAEEAEKLKKAFAAEQLMKEMAAMEKYIAIFSGESFGNEIAEGINKAAISLSKMNTMFDAQIKKQAEIKKQREEIAKSTVLDSDQKKKALTELSNQESLMLSDQLSGYSNMFGAIGQLYDENSQARKTMHVLEMAFAAAEIAINIQKAMTSAIAAITNQGAGDPYTAFARIAAMVALMGGVLSSLGVSISGGGSSSGGGTSSSTSGPTATAGTVFGDSTAESESVKNATELLSKFEEKQYSELRGIHREMISLNSNITGLISGLIRSVGGQFSKGLTAESLSPLENALSPITDLLGKIPLVGGLIGGVVGLIGGLFGGSKKTTITGSGISVNPTTIANTMAGGSADVSMYQDIQTKTKGALWGLGGSKTRNKTVYTEANDEVTKLFTQVFKDMGGTILSLSKGLGADLNTALSYAFSIPKLDLSGKTGSEITEAVTAAMSTAFDNAATAILGDIVGQYQKVSEGMFETAVRVYADQIIVLDALGKTGNATSGNILDLTQSIVNLAGGTDEFVSAFENYIELFTTENEKLGVSLEFTKDSISELGLIFPTTRKGFADLVSSLDVTTKSGQKAYVTLLGLADSADQLYSAIEDVMESVNDTLNKLGLSDAEKSLYELIKQYDEYIDTLKASGAALSDISKVEKARIGVLKEAAGDLLATIRGQVEDFAAAIKTAEDNIQNAYSNALSKRDSAQQRVNSLLEKSSVNLESFSKSIDSFLKSLDLKTLEDSFDNLKAQFMVTASAAAAGDSKAMENLLSQANSVLSGAQANSASKLDYDRTVAMVKSQVSMVQSSIAIPINNDLAEAQTELASATSELARFEVLAIKAGITLETAAEKTSRLLADLDESYNEAFLNNIIAQRQYQIALSLTNDLTFDAANAMSGLISNVNALRITMGAYNSSLGGANAVYNSSSFDPANIVYLTSQLGSAFDVLAEIEKFKGSISNQISGSFAVGTDYVPYDMTANIHQGERIVPAAYNRSDKTNAELLAEIQALRTEMNAVMYQVAKNTLKTADYAERSDGTVMRVTVVEEITEYQSEVQVVGNTIAAPDFAVMQESGTIAAQEDGTVWTQEGGS